LADLFLSRTKTISQYLGRTEAEIRDLDTATRESLLQEVVTTIDQLESIREKLED
jgi:hypothetical protein